MPRPSFFAAGYAALYYLAAMVEGGEDPRYIARRIIVLASEDVGNADPAALTVAVSCAHAVEHVGLPECTVALSQATIYLAMAPKSNVAGVAFGRARAEIAEHGAKIPPSPLRTAAYPAVRRGDGGIFAPCSAISARARPNATPATLDFGAMAR